MAALFLSRRGLAGVLQSLLWSELTAARGAPGRASERRDRAAATAWADDFSLAEDGPGSLGCDSLEALHLAGAAIEMFHLHEAARDADLLGDLRFGSWLDAIEATWRGGTRELTFTSSGSTGTPKRCIQRLDDLDTELDVLAGFFRTRRRIVALAPAHHIYGLLFTAGLADRLGAEVLAAAPLGPAALSATLRAGDLVVSFPERWAWLDRSLPRWPVDVEGVTSTAPCPAALKASLASRGLSGLTEVYGSSETAGVAVRRWPASTYTLMPHWRMETPTEGEPRTLVRRDGRRAALPDSIDLRADGTFDVVGRRDGAVQVGGTNVFPDHIATKLRQRPGVAHAAVRLMRPEEGSRLKAFVVARPDVGEEGLRADLERWIDRDLPACERPRLITFGPRLPVTGFGKASDW